MGTIESTQERKSFSIDCVVEEVVGKYSYVSYDTYPALRVRVTQSSEAYESLIRVKSDNDIKNIYFIGWPPIEKGDRIRAHFPEKERILIKDGKLAIKIEKLRGEEVVATYINLDH